jgi:hypothetical protein
MSDFCLSSSDFMSSTCSNMKKRPVAQGLQPFLMLDIKSLNRLVSIMIELIFCKYTNINSYDN